MRIGLAAAHSPRPRPAPAASTASRMPRCRDHSPSAHPPRAADLVCPRQSLRQVRRTVPAATRAAGERNSFRPNKQSLRKKVFPIVRTGNVKTRMWMTPPAPTKPSARRGRPDGNQASHRETGFAPGETAKAAEENYLARPSEDLCSSLECLRPNREIQADPLFDPRCAASRDS
jgi:hypothetical protein